MSPIFFVILLVLAAVVLAGVVRLFRGAREVNPLLRALQRRDHQHTIQLIEAGADVNVVGKLGLTPLTCAASQGNVQVVEALLKRGARLNEGPRSALANAAEYGQVETVRLLLRAGADVNGIAKDTKPIVAAASKGHVEIVDILISAGANVNASGFALAVERGHLDVVRLLLNAGADPNAKDWKGYPPLNMCAIGIQQGPEGERNYALAKELVELLLQAGADPKATDSGARDPVTYKVDKDRQGANALQWFVNSAGASPPGKAGRESLLEIVRTLLAAGADPSGALDALYYWRERYRRPFIPDNPIFKGMEEALTTTKVLRAPNEDG